MERRVPWEEKPEKRLRWERQADVTTVKKMMTGKRLSVRSGS